VDAVVPHDASSKPSSLASPTPGSPLPWRERPARRANVTFLSPVVRRLLHEHELDSTAVAGTGIGGRITRADVLAAVSRSTPVVERPPAPALQAEPAVPSGDEVVPFSAIRRRIAAHLVASKATAAHAFCAVEVDFVAVDRVRRAHRERWSAHEGFGLTYLPFVARAVIDALAEFPRLNASVVSTPDGGDALQVHRSVHLGVAVDLDHEGLIVPVVRDAETKRLRGIAREAVALAERARTGSLRPDDVSGGTFTITNPGPGGTLLSVPIINQPQVAILATDAIRRRPVVVSMPDGGDGIAVHPVGMLGISFDHRAIDGAEAAAFVQRTRELLETRDWSAEL
jgi:2-oxoglutarate dehydrogenase E2 component (dihydrolipoamide succinyltransferase)